MARGSLYETITTEHGIIERKGQRALGKLALSKSALGKMELGKLSFNLTQTLFDLGIPTQILKKFRWRISKTRTRVIIC